MTVPRPASQPTEGGGRGGVEPTRVCLTRPDLHRCTPIAMGTELWIAKSVSKTLLEKGSTPAACTAPTLTPSPSGYLHSVFEKTQFPTLTPNGSFTPPIAPLQDGPRSSTPISACPPTRAAASASSSAVSAGAALLWVWSHS